MAETAVWVLITQRSQVQILPRFLCPEPAHGPRSQNQTQALWVPTPPKVTLPVGYPHFGQLSLTERGPLLRGRGSGVIRAML